MHANVPIVYFSKFDNTIENDKDKLVLPWLKTKLCRMKSSCTDVIERNQCFLTSAEITKINSFSK